MAATYVSDILAQAPDMRLINERVRPIVQLGWGGEDAIKAFMLRRHM